MARLQRKDLVEEFSQVVQQEIVNHNGAVLASNMAIQELRKQLDEITAAFELRGHQSQTLFINHASQIETMHENLEKSIAKCQRDINDSNAKHLDQIQNLKKSFDDRESYYLRMEGFQEFKEKLDQWASNIQRSFAVQKDATRQQIEKSSDETKILIDTLRRSLQKSIAEEIEARKEQEKNLDIYAVNFSGVQRELEVLKKRCFIVEKNIENLYTQIERLKAVP